MRSEAELILLGYRPTTVIIIYRLPDHPRVLQEFIWQKLDLPPEYPELRGFVDYWKRNIHGKLHSVYIGDSGLWEPGLRTFNTEFRLH